MFMKEIKGNIWKMYDTGHTIVVPTNGFGLENGPYVMGGRIAEQAGERFPSLPFELGQAIRQDGNHVFWFWKLRLITFPIKRIWWEIADIEIINRSAQELSDLSLDGVIWKDRKKFPVMVPHVGCGNGELEWELVKPILEKHLDDRFTAVSLNETKIPEILDYLSKEIRSEGK